MKFTTQFKRKSYILLISIFLAFFVLNPINVQAKTEYDTFVIERPLYESSLKVIYQIKVSKFKKPTKSKCSNITIKVKRLNQQELLSQTTIDKLPSNSLVLNFLSADYQTARDRGGKRFGIPINWKNASDLKEKTEKKCLSYKWDAGKMVNPITVSVLSGSDFQVNFIK